MYIKCKSPHMTVHIYVIMYDNKDMYVYLWQYLSTWFWVTIWFCMTNFDMFDDVVESVIKSMVSCQKGPTRHAYTWQIGPFWQDTLYLSLPLYNAELLLIIHQCTDIVLINSVPAMYVVKYSY